MAQPRLTKLELQILEILWKHGTAAIREIQESFPPPQPAYTTIQTTVYRLEDKKAMHHVHKIGNADIFEPVIAHDMTRSRLLDKILSFFGESTQPMMAQLAEYKKLTIDDVQKLEKTIQKHEQEQKTAKADKKQSKK